MQNPLSKTGRERSGKKTKTNPLFHFEDEREATVMEWLDYMGDALTVGLHKPYSSDMKIALDVYWLTPEQAREVAAELVRLADELDPADGAAG